MHQKLYVFNFLDLDFATSCSAKRKYQLFPIKLCSSWSRIAVCKDFDWESGHDSWFAGRMILRKFAMRWARNIFAILSCGRCVDFLIGLCAFSFPTAALLHAFSSLGRCGRGGQSVRRQRRMRRRRVHCWQSATRLRFCLHMLRSNLKFPCKLLSLPNYCYDQWSTAWILSSNLCAFGAETGVDFPLHAALTCSESCTASSISFIIMVDHGVFPSHYDIFPSRSIGCFEHCSDHPSCHFCPISPTAGPWLRELEGSR